jgi:single-strand DNA-binding protein
MNKAIIIGNITRDPETRTTGQGTAVTTFTVAVARRFTNTQGERETDFIPVVTWRGLAETCARYLKKGSKVAVVGAIQTRSYEAQDGSKRYVTDIQADEVEFLTPKQEQTQQEKLPDFDALPDDDTDLPF